MSDFRKDFDFFDQPAPRKAFVTGGARGIGRGIVGQLLSQGFHVVFTYSRSTAQVESVYEEFREQQQFLEAIKLDLVEVSSAHVPAYVRSHLESASVIVNNAALSDEKPFTEIDSSDWNAMLAVNLIAPAQLLRIAIPPMLERKWGRVVNIVSIGGQTGGVNQVHYAASKAGLISLTRSISNLYSSKGVTCNAVSPGLIETDMSRAELSRSDGQSKLMSIPIGRVGRVEDVAPIVGFLASEEAGYITGQVVNVNGGTYLG